MAWIYHNNGAPSDIGFFAGYLDSGNPDNARDQLDAKWTPASGWIEADSLSDALLEIDETEDGKPVRPLASFNLHDEVVTIYVNAWISIVHADESASIAKIG